MLEFEFSSPMRDPYLGQTEHRHQIIENIYSEPSTEGGYSKPGFPMGSKNRNDANNRIDLIFTMKITENNCKSCDIKTIKYHDLQLFPVIFSVSIQ